MLPTAPIRASLDAFEWLSGRWTGESGTDRFEEAWSGPQHGTMLGMFRLFRAGAARFYELLALATEGDGLAFRFRHFDPDMVGWEERAEPLVFDLVQLDDELAQFAERHRTRWMTYRREGDNGLVVSFATGSGPSADEFHFVRG